MNKQSNLKCDENDFFKDVQCAKKVDVYLYIYIYRIFINFVELYFNILFL